MYCVYCGTEIEDDSVFCHNCGEATGVRPEEEPKEAPAPAPKAAEPVEAAVTELFSEEKPKKKNKYFGWKFFGFMLPLIAVFFWLAWQSNDDEVKSDKADAIGIGLLAVGAVLVGTVLPIIPGIILFFVIRKDHPEIAAAILFGTLFAIAISLIATIIGFLGPIIELFALIQEAMSYASAMAPLTLLI